MPWWRSPELFSTINFYYPPQFNGHSLVFLVGLAMIIILASFFLKNKTKLSQGRINQAILLLIFLFWLPNYLWFFINNLVDLKETWPRPNSTLGDRREDFICQLDKNQNLNNAICGLEKFSQYTRAIVPENTKLYFLTGANNNYFFYYDFAGAYKIVNNFKDADYIILYFSKDRIFLDDSKLYRIAGKNKIFQGNYTPIIIFNKQAAILKKI